MSPIISAARDPALSRCSPYGMLSTFPHVRVAKTKSVITKKPQHFKEVLGFIVIRRLAMEQSSQSSSARDPCLSAKLLRASCPTPFRPSSQAPTFKFVPDKFVALLLHCSPLNKVQGNKMQLSWFECHCVATLYFPCSSRSSLQALKRKNPC